MAVVRREVLQTLLSEVGFVAFWGVGGRFCNTRVGGDDGQAAWIVQGTLFRKLSVYLQTAQ